MFLRQNFGLPLTVKAVSFLSRIPRDYIFQTPTLPAAFKKCYKPASYDRSSPRPNKSENNLRWVVQKGDVGDKEGSDLPHGADKVAINLCWIMVMKNKDNYQITGLRYLDRFLLCSVLFQRGIRN